MILFTGGLFRTFAIDLLLKQRDLSAVTHGAEIKGMLAADPDFSIAVATNGINAIRPADALYTVGLPEEQHNIAAFLYEIFLEFKRNELPDGLNPVYWQKQSKRAKLFCEVKEEDKPVMDFLKDLEKLGITPEQWRQLINTEDRRRNLIFDAKKSHIIFNILNDNRIRREQEQKAAATESRSLKPVTNVQGVIFIDDSKA